MNWKILVFLAFGLPAAARADVSLGPLFTDHAVLQQGRPVPVWGQAAPGERVTVAFAGQRVAADAGPDGRWFVLLAPLAASGAGADLVAAGRTAAVAHDVVVGEVWLASGQSNMAFVLNDPNGDIFRVDNAAAEVAAAQHPLIRQFRVDARVAESPSNRLGGAWVPCTPKSAPEFSAVAYFFARELHQRLGVPVGIILSAWNGTRIESWMSPMAMASDPAFAVVGERWKHDVMAYPAAFAAWKTANDAWKQGLAAAQRKGPTAYAIYRHTHPDSPRPQGAGSPGTPMSLFDGMVNPLFPCAVRGTIWYQGEQNTSRPSEYHALFAAMIAAWRAHLGGPESPFYWVQLASYADPRDATGMNWAWLREAQQQALSLPDTGEAVALDIGDPENIHPRNKQEVGRRLALIAKAQIYGIPVDWSGPMFDRAVTEHHALRVFFRYAESGLIAGGGPLQSFELAGADGVFHPASASISGGTVLVTSPRVGAPTAVRYGWSDAPAANLFNGAGLPAAPFRSDGS